MGCWLRWIGGALPCAMLPCAMLAGCGLVLDLDPGAVDASQPPRDAATAVDGGADASVWPPDAGPPPPDAGPFDGGPPPPDAGADAGPLPTDAGSDGGPSCVATAEVCNGADDDCDGVIDEGANASCPVRDGFGVCSMGTCMVSACAAGRADCNGMLADGCETDTFRDRSSCGACGTACRTDEMCLGGACTAVLRASDIAAGGGHTCAVRSGSGSGATVCWGANGQGQLGDGTTVTRTRPVRATVLPAETVGELAMGLDHSCARQGDVARCWGNASGGATGVALPFGGGDGAQNTSGIGAGAHRTCGIQGGRGACWGNNTSGAFGNGSTVPASSASPVPFGGLMHDMVRQIDTGVGHTCIVRAAGEVHCAGRNGRGQLGDGRRTNSTSPVRMTRTGHVTLSVGDDHACTIVGSRDVGCWGSNANGQVSGVDDATSWRPTGVHGARDVSAGRAHSCAAADPGVAICWGDNAAGQLGDGTMSSRPTPQAVPELGGVTHVAAGGNHTCAIADGFVYCWGSNINGQLGDGTTRGSTVPVPVLAPAG